MNVLWLVRWAAIGGMSLAVLGEVRAQTWTVPQELWESPRSGASVLAQEPLREGVAAYLAHPGARVLIHHGSGEEAALQAEELRNWLIALAIEAGRIELIADGKSGEPLTMEITYDRLEEGAK